MKKLLAVLFVVVLFVSVSAFAENVAPGKYQTTIVSTNPTFNGQTATAETKTEAGKTIATVNFKDSKEVWTWDGNTLLQQEFDLTGKETLRYNAVNQNGKYVIECKDKTNNACDGNKDLDARTYWTVTTGANSFTYVTYRVDPAKAADATAQPTERHKMVFNTAK